MKLATTTSDLAAYAPTQTRAIQLMAKCGFKNFDYNFGIDLSRRDGIFGGDFEGYCADVRAEVEKLGASIVQAHSPMGRPIAPDSAEFSEQTALCVRACGLLGIPNIVIHSGYEQGLSREECFGKNREFFLPLLRLAEESGVNILVENFNKMCVPGLYWIDNAPDLLALIEYVDHPLFHAVWDTGHANMQEMSQAQGLKTLGSHVRGIHVHDNDGTDDSHLTPYLGTLSLDDLMQGLLAIDYPGFFTFEVGGIYSPAQKRRACSGSPRLQNPPLEARLAMEKYLYALGKGILESYNCFEE